MSLGEAATGEASKNDEGLPLHIMEAGARHAWAHARDSCCLCMVNAWSHGHTWHGNYQETFYIQIYHKLYHLGMCQFHRPFVGVT